MATELEVQQAARIAELEAQVGKPAATQPAATSAQEIRDVYTRAIFAVPPGKLIRPEKLEELRAQCEAATSVADVLNLVDAATETKYELGKLPSASQIF